MDDNQKFIALAAKLKSLESQLNDAKVYVTKVEKQIGPQGPKGDKGDDGQRGLDGLPGNPGKDGADGRDGNDGTDGVGIADVEVTFDNSLLVRLTDGREIDAGEINVQGAGSSAQPVQVIQQYAGPRIFVQATEPTGASVGDIWFDIS